MAQEHFYITTTLPYVNAQAHIGHAMEFIRADIIARFHAQKGEAVFFNTGTDEHGMKIHGKALEENVDPQAYVDRFAKKFQELLPLLGITETENITRAFIRTTDATHMAAAQEFWRRCAAHGSIYKKSYRVKYCVGCELEKTDSELENGVCPIHPNRALELIDEENYFFSFSSFAQKLTDFYTANPDFVVPSFRFNEIKAFVERGLEDFSISRLKSKMPWGVPVPDDADHVMYVWFDALVNYVSTIGWPSDEKKFSTWWPVTQYCGKDNLRQQSAMWQAMLLAAGLPNSRQIVINGFVTGEGGVKMSKSLGNTADPVALIQEYGTDMFRYYVARELSPFEDTPFTEERFRDAYNANLANGLGNLVSRVMKMATTNGVVFEEPLCDAFYQTTEMKEITAVYSAGFAAFDIKQAADAVWELISSSDRLIQDRAPFKLIKTDPVQAKAVMAGLLVRLSCIATLLAPIMPETAFEIQRLVSEGSMPQAPLFLRKA